MSFHLAELTTDRRQLRDTLATMAPIEHRLFHTAEMLEAILFELPQRDLLLSKAVCKLWNETIEKSKKLQRALYFVSDGAGRFIVGRGLLLLLQHYMSPQLLTSSDGVILKDPQTSLPQTVKPEPNPLLERMLQVLFLGYYELACHGKSILPKAYAHPRSSWRRMLLTQSPISSFYFYSVWKDLNTNRLDYLMDQIVNADRVTIDDWVKCLEKIQHRRGKRYRLSRSYMICELWDPALSNEVVPVPIYFGRDWTCT